MSNTSIRVLFLPSGNIEQFLREPNHLARRDTLLRCERAWAEWLAPGKNGDAGNFDYILVCGGLFNPSWVQTMPAAHIMRDWLLAQDSSGQLLDSQKIIVEAESLDTYENIKLGLTALSAAGIDLKKAKITVLTQWQHGWRFWITFLIAHRIWVCCIPMSYPLGLKAWCLEWLMIGYHLLDPHGTGTIAKYYRTRRARAARES